MIDYFKDIVLVCGLARSGTSWLGKILDSDPDVLYRYEPFNIKKCDIFANLSNYIKKNGIDKKADELLVEGFKKLPYIHNKHIVGNKPKFKKNFYRGNNIFQIFKFLHFFESQKYSKLFFLRKNIRLVVKIVEFDWGLQWISKTLGTPKILFIIRNPFGNVNSSKNVLKKDISEWTKVWIRVHEEIGLPYNVNIPNFKLIIYEELCERPMEVTIEIFKFLDWEMTSSTINFIKSSTQKNIGGNWSVLKSSMYSANKWRHTLTKQDILQINNIVKNSELIKLWENP